MARGVALGGKRFYWNVDPALGMAARVVAELRQGELRRKTWTATTVRNLPHRVGA
jgi:hypothetical protein